MEGGHLLVGEECVGDPYFLSNLGAHHQFTDAASGRECQTIVLPYLTEIKVGCKILQERRESLGTVLKGLVMHRALTGSPDGTDSMQTPDKHTRAHTRQLIKFDLIKQIEHALCKHYHLNFGDGADADDAHGYSHFHGQTCERTNTQTNNIIYAVQTILFH